MEPIKSILLNPSYDWSYIFNNPAIERPAGTPVFVSAKFFHRYVCSRIMILKDGDKYHMLCQFGMSLTRSNQISLEHSKYLQQYVSSRHFKVWDVNNPYYTCEYHYSINDSWYKFMLNEAKRMQSPDTGHGSGDSFHILSVKENAKLIEHRWEGNSNSQGEDMTRQLLNYTLIRHRSAYKILDKDSD